MPAGGFILQTIKNTMLILGRALCKTAAYSFSRRPQPQHLVCSTPLTSARKPHFEIMQRALDVVPAPSKHQATFDESADAGTMRA